MGEQPECDRSALLGRISTPPPERTLVLIITHISEGPAVAGLAIGCFHRKPRGGLFIGQNANCTPPFCFSAARHSQKRSHQIASVQTGPAHRNGPGAAPPKNKKNDLGGHRWL